MARLTNDELEELKSRAKLYYLHENITNHKELAEKIGTTPKTISKWVVEGNWKKYQRNFLLTREELMADYLEELIEIKQSVKNKPEGERFADFKLAQVRRSLTKDIEALETDAQIPEIISAMIQLTTFVRKEKGLDRAKAISQDADDFIKSLLRK